ncbi:MAG: hypothetical protein JWO86_8152 [Myxococcaceae bacterium]|nr:hypothetical protein [Myxococcaceae bacterium]
MKTVRPKPLGAQAQNLRLTPEEDFVLARCDGRLSVHDLVALTGMEEKRIERIVTNLQARGAVQLEAVEASSGYLPEVGSGPALPNDGEMTSLADFAAVLGMDPSAFAPQGARGAVEEPVAPERKESRSNYPPPATSEPPDALPDPTSEVVPVAAQAAPDSSEQLVADGPQLELEEVTDEEEAAADTEESQEAAVLKEQDYRKLYEAHFHPLTVDVRAGLAKVAHGPDLLALCLDADSRVIAGILENPSTGLQHVRLIAFHHRTGVGLEMVTRRQDFLRDLLVERRLLRNPMAGDTVLQRVMASKRLFQTYKIAIDREVPELTRSKSRGYMRQKYQNAPSEERADLVLRTEGRCLIYMTGCAFDAKMTGILCGRPYNSVLFIQNLAKFSATPPALLAHLMKQPFVRKHAPLKKILLQHPNMPGDVKRQH